MMLKKRTVLYEKVSATQKMLAKLNQENSIIPQIIFDREFRVVGIKRTVKPGDNSIKNLWDDFNLRKSEIESVARPDILLGLCEYMPDITDEDEFAYITCIEVNGFNNIPEGMVTKNIPHSKYAVFTHRGPIEELKSTYDFIYGYSGYELAELDTIELYNTNNASFEFSIYIPIK